MATHQKKHTKNTYGPRELIYRNEADDENYAIVNASKGDARFEITFYSNNVIAIAKVRGALISGPKKQRIEKGNLVLVQGDNSSTKGDKYFITHKYSDDDVKRLRKAGELAQIMEVGNEDKVTVAFESDVIIKKNKEIEVDESYIGNI